MTRPSNRRDGYLTPVALQDKWLPYRDRLWKHLAGNAPKPGLYFAPPGSEIVEKELVDLFRDGRPLRDASPVPGPGNWGCFFPENYIAWISSKPYETEDGFDGLIAASATLAGPASSHETQMRIVRHEMFHAYQWLEIQRGVDDVAHDLRAHEWDSAWSSLPKYPQLLAKYGSPEAALKAYYEHPVERDANTFSRNPNERHRPQPCSDHPAQTPISYGAKYRSPGTVPRVGACPIE